MPRFNGESGTIGAATVVGSDGATEAIVAVCTIAAVTAPSDADGSPPTMASCCGRAWRMADIAAPFADEMGAAAPVWPTTASIRDDGRRSTCTRASGPASRTPASAADTTTSTSSSSARTPRTCTPASSSRAAPTPPASSTPPSTASATTGPSAPATPRPASASSPSASRAPSASTTTPSATPASTDAARSPASTRPTS